MYTSPRGHTGDSPKDSLQLVSVLLGHGRHRLKWRQILLWTPLLQVALPLADAAEHSWALEHTTNILRAFALQWFTQNVACP